MQCCNTFDPWTPIFYCFNPVNGTGTRCRPVPCSYSLGFLSDPHLKQRRSKEFEKFQGKIKNQTYNCQVERCMFVPLVISTITINIILLKGKELKSELEIMKKFKCQTYLCRINSCWVMSTSMENNNRSLRCSF